MAQRKTASKGAEEPASGFTKEERAAMRERIRETRAKPGTQLDPEAEVLAKLAEMKGSDRVIGERIHAIMKSTAPALAPRTWYGMPAYSRGKDVVCWYQPAAKFGARYATFSFSDEAKLDEGHIWPISYALTELTASDEAKIVALVKKALS